MPTSLPSLFEVENPIRAYAWGSYTSLPDLFGTAFTGQPQAEMWLGSHPGDPSTVLSPAEFTGVRLDALLDREPGLLGGDRGYERQLPFLMKVLAAAQPLSLQVHPSPAQARAGFEREDAAGIGLDDPVRSYKDRFHKPEIIVAITDFSALCGFRAPSATADDLRTILTDIDLPVADELFAALAQPDETAALRQAFLLIMSGRSDVRALVHDLIERCTEAEGTTADTVRFAASCYGNDPGVLGACLLNRVHLAPGEALYLDAGNIHAYLTGTGLEAMAPSDNVLRGGLTTKHVDVEGLLDIVVFAPIEPTRVEPTIWRRGGTTLRSYRPPVREFSVHHVSVEGDGAVLETIVGPSMLVVSEGSLTVGTGAEDVTLQRGHGVFQAAGSALRVGSSSPGAAAWITTVGDLDTAAGDDTHEPS